ncbi:MAG: 30S ribosomal protein S20 [Clostridia bacterium]|nr:30S ribosomal protein S20 [Clostridia bacterium]
MANVKSAKKRVKVSKVRNERNKARNSALKTAIKKANAAIESNAADKEVLVRAAVKKIDQAAAKGLIHKNNAARKVSALSAKLKG